MASSGDGQRLNAGCGRDVLAGWVNLDEAQLDGVDVVHDLDVTPWPFPDHSFIEIRLINVLEHLSDTVGIMEEMSRLVAPDGRILVRVPCVNGPDATSDPTHKAFFNHHTLEFFDPTTKSGKERGYYSSAKFRIVRTTYYTRILPGLPYARASWRPLRSLMSALAVFVGGIIWSVEVELRVAR